MFVSKLINGFFDLLLSPFGDRHWPVLVVVSLLAGVLLLWLFKIVTPQQKLARARAKLMGHLYELSLYQDDLGVLMRVQKDLLLSNLRYVVLTLPALVVLVPPAVLILVQLESRLQHPALDVGDTFLVEASYDTPSGNDVDQLTTAKLQVGDGLVIDSPRVRDYTERTVWWRVQVTDPGWHELTLVEGDRRLDMTVKAADGLQRYSLKRERSGWFAALGNPGADPLPAETSLRSLTLYPEVPEASWFSQGWFWWFGAISVLGGLAAKRLLRVEI